MEHRSLIESPTEFVQAHPDSSNILLWYYTLDGPAGTPYEGGTYCGKLRFPPNYPFAPPSVLMTTPNGRFLTEQRLCLSMSDFHPETWSPMWNVSAILTGLLSFMVSEEAASGSTSSSTSTRKMYAETSHAFNLRLDFFKKYFPEKAAESQEILERRAAPAAENHGSASAVSKAPVAVRGGFLWLFQSVAIVAAFVAFVYAYFGRRR